MPLSAVPGEAPNGIGRRVRRLGQVPHRQRLFTSARPPRHRPAPQPLPPQVEVTPAALNAHRNEQISPRKPVRPKRTPAVAFHIAMEAFDDLARPEFARFASANPMLFQAAAPHVERHRES